MQLVTVQFVVCFYLFRWLCLWHGLGAFFSCIYITHFCSAEFRL